MKKPFYIVFIAIVLVLCLIPSIGLIAAGPSDAAANEAPHVMPSLKNFDGSWNTDYLSGLRDYIGYGFFGRLQGITAWDTLCAKLFRSSANDDVLIGPDGWLFYGAAADELSGSSLMTDVQLRACAENLSLMREYTESRGAQFIFTVPCGKYTLYPEHAPEYVTVEDGSNLASLSALLPEYDITYADLYAAFTAQDEELYWKWDSHWNAKGAALAADTILTAAGIDSDWFDGPFNEELNHTGDLYEMLYPAGTDLEVDYVPVEDYTFEYVSSFHNYDDITIQTTCAEGSGSLLLFRDSSGRNLYPYLAETFESTYISRLNNYRLDYIDEQGADLVVVELAQRTLPYLLEYPAVYPAPQRPDGVPDNAQAADCTPVIEEGTITYDGYVCVSGMLEGGCPGGAVYLSADGVVYEASQTEDGFSAWLPDTVSADTLTVYTVG